MSGMMGGGMQGLGGNGQGMSPLLSLLMARNNSGSGVNMGSPMSSMIAGGGSGVGPFSGYMAPQAQARGSNMTGGGGGQTLPLANLSQNSGGGGGAGGGMGSLGTTLQALNTLRNGQNGAMGGVSTAGQNTSVPNMANFLQSSPYSMGAGIGMANSPYAASNSTTGNMMNQINPSWGTQLGNWWDQTGLNPSNWNW